METGFIHVTQSPTQGYARLSAEVNYDDRRVAPETYWFDVPVSVAESLSTGGNPWVALLLPLAVTIREPLRLPLPVDGVLAENAQRLMDIWKAWYPELATVPIEAERIPAVAPSPPGAGKKATMFSGGIDSSTTLLRSRASSDARLDDLLLVWGFDIPLSNALGFQAHRGSMQVVADHFGVRLVDVATNLKDTRLRSAGWGKLFHGPALAAVALTLEQRYAQVLIPSTHSLDALVPWGSHPQTDPLLSTSATSIRQDGAELTRVEKTAIVAASDVLLQRLRVCTHSFTEQNCCACPKCYRTMITLELLGALDRCRPLQRRPLRLRQISRIYSQDENAALFLKELERFASSVRRADVAAAISLSIARSGHLRKWVRLLGRLSRTRLLWRVVPFLERQLLRGWIS